MKFTIEVDVDWLGEDGSLDAELQSKVVHQIEQRVSAAAMERLEQEASSRVGSIIDEAVNKLLASWLEKPVTITDRYGDVKEKGAITELIKKRFDAFWQEKVDQNGRTDSYSRNETRLQWLIDGRITKHCKGFAEGLAKEVNAQVEKVMTDKLKLALGAELVDRLGVPALVKRIAGDHS